MISNGITWQNRVTAIDALTQYLRRQSTFSLVAHGLAISFSIGLLDYLIGNQLIILPLYLVPIFAVALGGGQKAGRITAAASLGITLGVDLAHTGQVAQPSWMYANWAVTLAIFLATAHVGAALERVLARERELARTDHLTGSLNRRAFFEAAAREISRAHRVPRPLTIAYIDVDNFKQINDRFGHATGDKLLWLMANIMRRDLRLHDISARLGGDEFAVLLPETGHTASRAVIERLNKRLRDAIHHHGWPVTLSIGVVTYCAPPRSADELVRAADQAMYAVKRVGKNMIRYEIWNASEGHSE